MEITIITRSTTWSWWIWTHTHWLLLEMIADARINKINVISPHDDEIPRDYKIIHYPIKLFWKTFITKSLQFYFMAGNLIKRNGLESTNIIAQFRFFGRYKKLFHIFHWTHTGLMHTHMKFYCGLIDIIGLVFNRFYQFMDIYCMYVSTKNLYVSKVTMDLMNTKYPTFSRKNVYLPNFIANENANISSRKIDDVNKSSAIVLWYIGRLDPLKWVDRLCSLLQRNMEKLEAIMGRKIELHVIGNGMLESSIQKYPFVVFHGHKNHQDVLPYYSQFDLLVFPSRYENFPTVILEWLSHKCLILSRNVWDCPLILPEMYVFESDLGFLDKICKLIMSDSKERESMLENGYNLSKKYDRKEIYGCFIQYISE